MTHYERITFVCGDEYTAEMNDMTAASLARVLLDLAPEETSVHDEPASGEDDVVEETRIGGRRYRVTRNWLKGYAGIERILPRTGTA